jgi:mono/diheme cytochrome c family protein
MMRASLISILLLGAAAVVAQTGSTGTPTKQQPAKQQATQSEGERVFEVNCQRCHRPPEQLSPKITGSVLRHMRVRATLTKEDEQAILKYLAP